MNEYIIMFIIGIAAFICSFKEKEEGGKLALLIISLVFLIGFFYHIKLAIECYINTKS